MFVYIHSGEAMSGKNYTFFLYQIPDTWKIYVFQFVTCLYVNMVKLYVK